MCKQIYFYIILSWLSWHGVLAQNYWQQEANYKIDVVLDDQHHILHASEEITYVNHSPDALPFIWMHLWPNAFKNRHTAFARQQLENGITKFYFTDEKNRGYIDSLDFKVNGEAVNWEFHPQHPDICRLILKEPLQPGDSIVISTPFRVKLPASFSRLGHVSHAYQITQWYPKPAVYDRKGWHEMPYLDQGEFYSEFGSFEVSITLPKNYVVGATGNLQDPEEIAWLKEKAQVAAAMTEFPADDHFPASDPETKTLHYRQDSIHDFAWFADKRFNVLKGEVTLPASKRKVDTWIMFTNRNAKLWTKAIDYMNNAIYYYSLWNGDYPYNQATAVDGALSAGGGMEYPTVTVIGAVGSDLALETVIVHELGHNWFYGVLASNERRHAWMDEGLNSLNELRYLETRYPKMNLFDALAPQLANIVGAKGLVQRKQYELLYLLTARRGLDQPMNLPAREFTQINYAGIVYAKTAVVFNHVRHYLGNEQFDAVMRKYYDTWKFKHPYPEDLRQIFEQETGKNWSWLFDELIPTNRKIDYTINNATITNDGWMNLVVTNRRTVPAPFSISALRDNRVVHTEWYEGFAEDVRPLRFPAGDYDWLTVDAQEVMADISRSNNSLEVKGGRNNRIPPLQLRLIGAIENPRRTQVFFAPVIGANTADKFMAGLAFYNNLVPGSKHQYLIMPMYSTGRKDLTGTASVDFNFFPHSTFRKVTFTGQVAAYAGFLKAEPKLTLTVMPKQLKFSPQHTITLRHTFMSITNTVLPIYSSRLFSDVNRRTDPLTQYSIFSAQYDISQGNALREWAISGVVQNKQSDFTLITAEARYKKLYSRRNAIRFRAFAGGFLHQRFDPGPFALGLSGSLDYLADHILLDRKQVSRNLTAFSKQRIPDQGGFMAPTSVFTDKGLITLQADLDMPVVPLSIYGDVGFLFNRGSFADNFYSGTGVNLNIFKQSFVVHFPLAGSNFANTTPADFREFKQNIRFTLRLNQLNPFRFLNKVISQ